MYQQTLLAHDYKKSIFKQVATTVSFWGFGFIMLSILKKNTKLLWNFWEIAPFKRMWKSVFHTQSPSVEINTFQISNFAIFMFATREGWVELISVKHYHQLSCLNSVFSYSCSTYYPIFSFSLMCKLCNAMKSISSRIGTPFLLRWQNDGRVGRAVLWMS